MTGSLQTKNGSYYAVLNIKDGNGKRKQKWVFLDIPDVKGNKRKAESALKALIAEYEKRDGLQWTDILFADYLVEWLELHKPNITQGTYEGYCFGIRKHLYPYYMSLNVKLTDVTPHQIQAFCTNLLERGQSPCSIRKYHSLVRKCLQHALQMNLILFNPADRVALPKKQPAKIGFYTPEQAAVLLNVAKGSTIEVPIWLAVNFGLRRSEILGLKWSAVDFDKSTFRVCATVIKMNSRIEREGTKNKASTRTLAMTEGQRTFLAEVKAQQEAQRQLCGNDYVDSEYVCRWPNGEPLKVEYISRSFKRFLKKHELPVIRFHDLRHSAASILIASNMDISSVSAFLGHSQTSTTLNIYAHAFESAKLEVANVMENALRMKSERC